MSGEVTNKILTLPNLISIIRLLLVPIFAVLLVVYQNNIAAFVLFLIAASTDFLDGAIARATGQVSRLGQQLDPLVDRVLILTAVILVYIVGRVPLWVLLLIVARDLSMLVLLAQLRITGQPKLKVAFVGKVATAIIMTGFCLLILDWPYIPGLGIFNSDVLPGWGSDSAALGIWFIYIGVVLAWAAGIYYMVRAYQSSQHPKNGFTGRQGEEQRNGARDSHAQQGESPTSFHDAYVYASGQRPSLNTTSPRSARHNTAARKPQKNDSTAAKRQAVKNGADFGVTQSRGAGAVILSVLNTPKKLLIALVIALLFVFTCGFYIFDGVSNLGVIHSGVRVGTIDVGKMTEDEAAVQITADITAIAESAPIHFFADEEALAAGTNDTTLELGNGVLAYNQEEINPDATSWGATLSTFDAEVNGAQLAEDAYGVGRNGDFILGRVAASTFGVTIAPRVDFSTDRLKGLESMLTSNIGTPMENADISFDGKSFVAEDGQDGYVVDDEQFRQLLQSAFLSDEREFVVPMIERAMQVTLEDAEKVAEATMQAIAQPVTVSFEGDSWTLSSEELGKYITTSVEEDASGGGRLVASVSADLLEANLPEVTGYIEDQVSPLNAEFKEVEGELQIIPSQNGTGVDYSQLADDLNAVLFDEVSNPNVDSTIIASRTVPMQIGVLEPKMLTSEAEAYDFATKISEYTIEYWWVPEGTITNIHVASDLINSSIIAPGGTWSFNDTAGECTADKGFVTAQVILGNEYVDEIGGGVCSVASTVFNAAYEAGYPIIERVNHSMRLSRYPVGRDAAIAYPFIDLKFENDTGNYLLLTMSYTDYSVTCTLWGISPGYRVESVTGELVESGEFPKVEEVDEELAEGESYVDQEGKKACKVDVTRAVYDAEGNLKEQRVFYSSYDPTPEITKVAPKVASDP